MSLRMLLLLTICLGAIRLGGGIYEMLLVDPRWPSNVRLIQPQHGGINRKHFWMLAHSAFEICLVLAIWMAWQTAPARLYVLLALLADVAMRTWSFAYFIPAALKFESAETWTATLRSQAVAWTGLSKCRPLLDLLALILVAMAFWVA